MVKRVGLVPYFGLIAGDRCERHSSGPFDSELFPTLWRRHLAAVDNTGLQISASGPCHYRPGGGIIHPTLCRAACCFCKQVADQLAAVRRQCNGSGARCRSKLLRPESDQSVASPNDAMANRLLACRDNRPATGEHRGTDAIVTGPAINYLGAKRLSARSTMLDHWRISRWRTNISYKVLSPKDHKACNAPYSKSYGRGARCAADVADAKSLQRSALRSISMVGPVFRQCRRRHKLRFLNH